MEQATNLFNKGLQMDTHPMVLGNDSLTDCLNGTLITMNGNEVILLNDMGNRRVDNAFLPAGYEPVGIKEYGGIIYIAAYNPITNKSQIGSFPSPERKISPDDIKSGLKGTFDFSSLEEYTTKDSLNYLNNDTILVPLTSNNVLHAGDKFVVYADGIDAIKEDITNYNNTTSRGKIKSPKNKKYTLLLGILNSLNEFVDITKNLCRWKVKNSKSYIVSYTNESDLYKFNDGYFIANSLPDIPTPDYTKSDLELIKKRLVITANTYSYKLIGPLYLKATLNHIQDFNYNIYGNKTNNNTADIYIEATITYNCPDGITTDSSLDKFDDYYSSYEIGKVQSPNAFFDFYVNNIKQTNPTLLNLNNTIISYDNSTNLYSVKIIKKYSGVLANNEGIINYRIEVFPNNSFSNSNIYLESLAGFGKLDLNKLGSGSVDLIGWRFFNSMDSNAPTTDLVYEFETYPKYGYELLNFDLIFTRIGTETTKSFEIKNNPIYNGRNTISIDWNTSTLSKDNKELYKVKMTIILKAKTELIGQAPDITIEYVRWFITTKLMNDCYISSNSNYILDYGIENSILTQKLTFYLDSNLHIVEDESEINYGKILPESWLHHYNDPTTDLIYDVNCEHLFNLNLSYKPDISIKNENLYPDFIKVSGIVEIGSSENSHPIKLQPVDESEILNNLKKVDNYGKLEDLSDFVDDGSIYQLSLSKGKISGYIKFYDKFRTEGDNSKIIKNPFGKVSENLWKALFGSNEVPTKYGGLGVDYDAAEASYVNLYYSDRSEVEFERPDGEAPNPRDGYRIGAKDVEPPNTFFFEDLYSNIFSIWNADNNNVILYIYETPPQNQNTLYFNGFASTTNRELPSLPCTTYAMVWWRANDGTWARFAELKPKNTSIKDFLLKQLSLKEIDGLSLYYVYCFADSIPCSIAKYSIPNKTCYIYNDKYNIPVTINIPYRNKNINIIGTTNKVQCYKKIGNTIVRLAEISFKNIADTTWKEYLHTIYLISSKNFLEITLNNLTKDFVLENIDLDTGLTLDNDNNQLSPKKLYLYNNGVLIMQNYPGIEFTSEYGRNIDGITYRSILYNPQLSGYNPRYIVAGWIESHDWTVLDMEGSKVVKVIN